MKQIIILFTAFLMTVTLGFSQKKKEFDKPIHLLIFSKTAGYRHASISSGIKMLYDQSPKQNWVITATEDASLFTDDFLKTFDVAVFLNPTGDALNDDEQKAFEKWLEKGKGFVGIHAATDFEYDWPFYGNLTGAYFLTHPPAQEATVVFENFDHPAMKPFEGKKSYTTVDEYYSFRANPRDKVHVLAHLDENSIKKSNNDKWKMGDYPVIWWTENDGIRMFYTVYGHTHNAFKDPLIIEHITNAINWAARRID
ncbi:MAG: ThuA domain-containing protein [Chlorobi bacterium]|nr:ThuA domain-containing protein [Chlorobiota bacterium]